MYPSQFDYYAPTSLSEAISILSGSAGEAKVLAGGHSLLPLLKLRMTETRALVDIGRIRDLAYIRRQGDGVLIGPMTTHADIEHSDALRQALPLLPEAARVIGDLQVRNRGTIGGSLAHGDPAGDFPAVVVALEAELKVVGPNGERRVPAREFFLGMLTTDLQADEILAEIRIPVLPPRSGTSYQKFPQPASRYAICGVAAVLTLGDEDRARQVRVGITGVGPKAYRAEAVERALAGQPVTPETISAAAQHAHEGIEYPLEDLHASGEYREHLARVLARRALLKGYERARAS